MEFVEEIALPLSGRTTGGDLPGDPGAGAPSSQRGGPRFNFWPGGWIPHATTKTQCRPKNN